MNPLAPTHQELVTALAKDGQHIIVSLTPETAHLWHMATGMIGEIYELQIGYTDGDLENVKEELGDLFFYTRGATFFFDDFNFDEVAIPKIDWDMPLDSLRQAVCEFHDLAKKRVLYCLNDDVFNVDFHDKLVTCIKTLKVFTIQTGFSIEDIQQANIDKLLVRYQKMEYSNDAAQKRADKND